MASNTSTRSKSGENTRAQSSAKKKTVRKPVVTKKAKKTLEDGGEQATLVLDPVLVINSASELHDKFSSVLDKSHKEIVIDASLVEMIDTAIIQLLFSLISALKSNAIEVKWRSPSAEFVSRVRSLGLSDIFGLDYSVE
jgi:anti-anti-sigma regulatory factor